MSVLNLRSKSEQDRKPALDAVHPKYAELGQHWQVLLDALDGTGGFATGEYLWKFPSELTIVDPATSGLTSKAVTVDEFAQRKGQARYHNFVEALVDLYVRYLFSTPPDRKSSNADLEAFWTNVDGAGLSMDDFVRRALAMALATSHCGALVDKTPDQPEGPSKADEAGHVYVTLYPPTSIPDWRIREGELRSIKLRECVTSDDITETNTEGYRYLLWDTEAWARFEEDGKSTAGGEGEAFDEHGLGLVPFAFLVPKPSVVDPSVGRPLIGNAKIVQALFNRCSEEDHVLRGQAFSQLVATLPPEATADDVTLTQKTISASYGVQRAIVVKGTLDFITPDMAAPAQVAENIQFLIREMFRAAHVPFDNESREAESAEAIALKTRALSQMLQGTAAACAAFERQIAKYYLSWTITDTAKLDDEFEKAKVEIVYPREFSTESLLNDLEAWGQAILAVHSDSFRKRIEKKIAKRVDPDVAHNVNDWTTIEGEIDASQNDAAAAGTDPMAQGLRDRAASRLGKFLQTPDGAAA